MIAPTLIARHVFISGRVQGVGYRDWLRSQARHHALSGWVRNRIDGSVEALLAGEANEVISTIAACHRGPPLARVDKVAQTEAAVPTESGFHRMPTL
jgi:acylphosphatase